MTERIYGKPGASLEQGTELDETNSRIGAHGERMTAAELDRLVLTNSTAQIFHSVKLPGEQWDIDHVLVTKEAGFVRLFVIDSKRWKGSSSYLFDYDFAQKKHLVTRDGQEFPGGIVSTVSESESLYYHLAQSLNALGESHVVVHTVLVIDNDHVTINHGRKLMYGDRESKMEMSFVAVQLKDMYGMLPDVFVGGTDAYVNGAYDIITEQMKGLVAWQTAPAIPAPAEMNPSAYVPTRTPEYRGFTGAEVGPVRSPNMRYIEEPESRIPLVLGILGLVLNIFMLFFAPLTWIFSGLYLLVTGGLMIFNIGRTKLGIASTILSAVTTVVGIGIVAVAVIASMQT